MYEQNSSENLTNSPSARSYVIFKEMFLYSEYLAIINFESSKIAFTRRRTNNKLQNQCILTY